jgi:uncharacterized protein
MATQKDKEYEDSILQWRATRYDALVRENGWLALAGLYWLKRGRNLLGSNPMCEVVLPERAPTFLGIVEWNGNTAHFQAAEGVRVQINGKSAQKALLHPSKDPKPSFITWNNLRMVVHEHADKSAIRVWDNDREERNSQPPLKWFPIDKSFRIPARYTRHPQAQVSEQQDTFGDMVEDRVDGFVTFKFDGKTYKLNASETSDHKLFIKFRDETSKKETYPPCRYYYTEPVTDGKVVLDFNRAYSPPCAFTPYATCIFASAQNTLPFRVEAGEIYRG